MLQVAIENKVKEFLSKYRERDVSGLYLAAQNRFMPEKKILTGVVPLSVQQSQIDDKKLRAHRQTDPFTFRISSRYMHRIPSIDNLILILCLKGIPTGDFSQALSAILRERALGFSPANIARLKARFNKVWAKRDISDKNYVYFCLSYEGRQRKNWLRLKGYNLIPLVLEKRVFVGEYGRKRMNG